MANPINDDFGGVAAVPVNDDFGGIALPTPGAAKAPMRDPYKDREEQLLASRNANLAAGQRRGLDGPADPSRFQMDGAELAGLAAQRREQGKQAPYESMGPIYRGLAAYRSGVTSVGENMSNALRHGAEAIGIPGQYVGASDQQVADSQEAAARLVGGSNVRAGLAATGRTLPALGVAATAPQTFVGQTAAAAAMSPPGHRVLGATLGAGGYAAPPLLAAAAPYVVPSVARVLGRALSGPQSTGAGAALEARGVRDVLTPGQIRPGTATSDLEGGIASLPGPGGRMVRNAQRASANEVLGRDFNEVLGRAGEQPVPTAEVGRYGVNDWLHRAEEAVGNAYERIFNQQVQRPGVLKLTLRGTRQEQVPGTAGEADAPIFQSRTTDPQYQHGEQIVEGYPTKAGEQRGAIFEGSPGARRTDLDPDYQPTPTPANGAEADEAAYLADQGLAPTPQARGTEVGPTVQGSLQHPRGATTMPQDPMRVTPGAMAEVEEGAVPPPRAGAPQFREVPTETVELTPYTTHAPRRETTVEVPASEPSNADLYAGPAAPTMRPIGHEDITQQGTSLMEQGSALGLTDPEAREVMGRFEGIVRSALGGGLGQGELAAPTWENLWRARVNMRNLINSGQSLKPMVADQLKRGEEWLTALLEKDMDPSTLAQFRAADDAWRRVQTLRQSAADPAYGTSGPPGFNPRGVEGAWRGRTDAKMPAGGQGSPEQQLYSDLGDASAPSWPRDPEPQFSPHVFHRLLDYGRTYAIGPLLYNDPMLNLYRGTTGWQQGLRGVGAGGPLPEAPGAIFKEALRGPVAAGVTDPRYRLTPPPWMNTEVIPNDEYKEPTR